jgi:hypothetical protein
VTGDPSARKAELGAAASGPENSSPYSVATSQSKRLLAVVHTFQRGCSTRYSTVLPSRWRT